MYGVEHIVIRAAGLIIADYLIRSYYVFARTRAWHFIVNISAFILWVAFWSLFVYSRAHLPVEETFDGGGGVGLASDSKR